LICVFMGISIFHKVNFRFIVLGFFSY